MDDVTPLNIWSRTDEETGRLMSHFAHTPFVLDGVEFGSVEAYYSWLALADNTARREPALPKLKADFFDYHGQTIR